MQFYLFPSKATSCGDEVPEAFSNFLQGNDAWGEFSEYFILSKATGKNLDIFNERAVDEADESQTAWTEVGPLKKALLDFQSALQMRPDWQNIVRYDARKTKYDSLTSAMLAMRQPDERLQSEHAALDAELYGDDKHPDAYFPPTEDICRKANFKNNYLKSSRCSNALSKPA